MHVLGCVQVYSCVSFLLTGNNRVELEISLLRRGCERFFRCVPPIFVWSRSVLVDEANENVLEERVGGEYVSFRVYVFLLKAREASVRDVYHGCGLSSPSLALHHLEKLEGLNLVRKDENGVYHVIARKFGVLHFFYRTGTWLVPRSFYFMIMYAAIAIASALMLPSGMREVGIIISAIGFTISLADTVLFLKLITHRSKSRTVPFNN